MVTRKPKSSNRPARKATQPSARKRDSTLRPLDTEVLPAAETHGELEPAADEASDSSLKRAISPVNPLRRYLDEVQRHPLLEAGEEFELAARLQRTGDLE